jgi:hypothetical protein
MSRMLRTRTVLPIATLSPIAWPARTAAQDCDSDRALTIVGPPHASQEENHEGRP